MTAHRELYARLPVSQSAHFHCRHSPFKDYTDSAFGGGGEVRATWGTASHLMWGTAGESRASG